MHLLDREIAAKLGTLQSLDDAIAYRSSRLDLPCPDCTTQQKCTDHSYDAGLLENYQERYVKAFQDAVTDMDANDIARILQPGEGVPPLGDILAIAMAAQLRKLAADGPVMTNFDDRPVVFEVDGPDLIATPMTEDSDDGEALS
jgi:hypothetical protein